jgi:hypothetical protein
MEKTILQKLFDAQQEIGKVVKNAKNQHFKKTYADINAIVDAVEPILNKHGLMLIQPIEDGIVKTRIINVENGETIESAMPLVMSGTPQAMGSQITYYRRYTLQSLLCLQVEDDDAQIASNQKPNFTAANFAAAHAKGSTIEQIKQAANVTPEVEQAYNEFVKSKTAK